MCISKSLTHFTSPNCSAGISIRDIIRDASRVRRVTQTPNVCEGVELRLAGRPRRFAEEDVVVGVGIEGRIEVNQIDAGVGKLFGVSEPLEVVPEIKAVHFPVVYRLGRRDASSGAFRPPPGDAPAARVHNKATGFIRTGSLGCNTPSGSSWRGVAAATGLQDHPEADVWAQSAFRTILTPMFGINDSPHLYVHLMDAGKGRVCYACQQHYRSEEPAPNT